MHAEAGMEKPVVIIRVPFSPWARFLGANLRTMCIETRRMRWYRFRVILTF